MSTDHSDDLDISPESPHDHLDGEDQVDELAEDVAVILPPPRGHDPACWTAII